MLRSTPRPGPRGGRRTARGWDGTPKRDGKRRNRTGASETDASSAGRTTHMSAQHTSDRGGAGIGLATARPRRCHAGRRRGAAAGDITQVHGGGGRPGPSGAHAGPFTTRICRIKTLSQLMKRLETSFHKKDMSSLETNNYVIGGQKVRKKLKIEEVKYF